jgi:hypothetical protein
MRSETEGGVLDIHFGKKTNVDIGLISLVEKNTYMSYMTGCMSITPTYGSNGDPPGSTTSATCG